MSTDSGEQIFSIGRRLREERERLKLSQETFATRLGATGRTIKKYESGETSPRATDLFVAWGIGVDIYYVVTGARLPIGIEEARAPYSPAEHLAVHINGLQLTEDDAAMLRALSDRLKR